MRIFTLLSLLFVLSSFSLKISDDFSDGDFVVNPVWYGDIHKFKVDEDYRLCLSADRQSGNARLFVLSDAVLSTSWEFSVQMNFNPSANNNVRVYLCADTTDIGKLWGLCLRIGANKEIALWDEPLSGNGKCLLRGQENRLNIDRISMSVKAVLNEDGEFSLYTKLEGESDFILEGATDLKEIPQSKFFGVFCTYTTTRHEGYFYFDNFRISSDFENILPPEPEEPEEPETGDEGDLEIADSLDVIVNEVLYQPYSGGDEFVELFNRSEKTIDISQLSIATRKSDGSLQRIKPLATSSVLLNAGEYLLVTGLKANVCNFYSCCEEAVFSELTSMVALSDAGNSVVILNNKNSRIIDELIYNKTLHSAGLSDTRGVSLERIDPEKNTNDPVNWASAIAETGYASPGCPNSSRQEDLSDGSGIEVEVIEPAMTVGLDYYQIKYFVGEAGARCNVIIFDITGKVVEQVANNVLLGTEGMLTWRPAGSVHRGLHVVYVEIYRQEGHVKKFKLPVVIR